MGGEICDQEHRGHDLMGYQKAVATVLNFAKRLKRPSESVALELAVGRVLAEEVQLDRDEPPVPRSAMDGFAARSEDGAALRKILGTVFAGTSKIPQLGPQEAVAVMTGGTVPPGADVVIPIEHCVVDGDSVRFENTPVAGRHVRLAGEMGAQGRVLLEPGVVLADADLAAIAGCGFSEVNVFPQPQAIVISTGDEVVDWNSRPTSHQVRDSNRLGSALQLKRAGAHILRHLHVPDEEKALSHAVREALQDVDLIVTIGGVSMGERDFMPTVFKELAVEELFHGVSIQPGKPVWVGRHRDTWVLGLPGNPISSFVTLEAFGLPLVRKLGGVQRPDTARAPESGIAGGPARSKKRERFLPADLSLDVNGQTVVTPRPEHGSGDWTSLAGATALLHLPPKTQLETGQPAQFLRLNSAL
ncbi:MAG TPA: molybdopterin molybdotransferase MoeA [Planctomycetota bacterium]|jgi:molybdopterin molybdotransferase|nr:molybdopterin molybdotransferase MoeA [Planctomycetota bacterium]HJM40457.1 molybdopterin molybdotransferase MoeA [Planctomycetota bacterium]|tara:strand:- start:12917 stop:14164 length:1248 start_codon:yes stop_codon:yes gene_type:complete